MDIKGKDFLSTGDFTTAELTSLIDLAAKIKAREYHDKPLAGRSIALVFFNPSLRTRTSMEVAIYELGGNAPALDIGKGTWSLEYREGVVMDGDKTEHIIEAARVLSRYVAGIGVRAFPEMNNYAEDIQDQVVRGFSRRDGCAGAKIRVRSRCDSRHRENAMLQAVEVDWQGWHRCAWSRTCLGAAGTVRGRVATTAATATGTSCCRRASLLVALGQERRRIHLPKHRCVKGERFGVIRV